MARVVSGRGRRWLVAALILSLLLRLPFLRLPMISDEGGYAYVAQRWWDGRGHLYDDLWVSRPQGIFAVYGFIQRSRSSGWRARRAPASPRGGPV